MINAKYAKYALYAFYAIYAVMCIKNNSIYYIDIFIGTVCSNASELTLLSCHSLCHAGSFGAK